MKRCMLLIIVLVLFVLGTAIAADTKQEIYVSVENEYAAFVRHAKKTLVIKQRMNSLKPKIFNKNVSNLEILLFIGSIRLYNDRVNSYNFYSDRFGEENWSLFENRDDLPPRTFLLLDTKGDPIIDDSDVCTDSGISKFIII